MNLEYNRAVDPEVLEIVEYYKDLGGTELASEFFDELLDFIDRIASRPESFRIHRDQIRRAKLARFPYNILFRLVDEQTVRILVVRHDRSHPSFGLDRQ